MNNSKTATICHIALAAAMLAVGGFIKINVFAVPFTLQTFFICFIAVLLDVKKSTAAVGIYIILGLIGVPIFANGGGFSYVLQPSFGYIIGFLLGTLTTGFILKNKKKSLFNSIAACCAALVVIYIFGSVYFYILAKFYLNSDKGIWYIIVYCVLVFVPSDLTFACFACFAALKIKNVLQKNSARTRESNFEPYLSKTEKDKKDFTADKQNIVSCDSSDKKRDFQNIENK